MVHSEIMHPSGRTKVRSSEPTDLQWDVVSQLTDPTEHKPRIRPKESNHGIEDLPSLSQKAAQSDKLSAAEILKSFGLEVSGAGKGAEVWFVGASEETENKEAQVDMAVEAAETPFGGPDGGKRKQ